MGNIYLYATGFLGHWWPLVSAGSLLGLEEFVQRYWPWLKEKLARIPDGWRRNGRVAALLAAAIYSGYLAWSDEHTALLDAQNKVQNDKSPSEQAFNRLTGDLMEARGKIDSLQSIIDRQDKQLSEQNSKVEALQPKPARVLTEKQKSDLKWNFAAIASNFQTLEISAPMNDGEAQAYARQLADEFKSIGIAVPQVGALIPTSAPNDGPKLQIVIKDLKHPPKKAELFATTMLNSGFAVTAGMMPTLGDDQFILVVAGQR